MIKWCDKLNGRGWSFQSDKLSHFSSSALQTLETIPLEKLSTSLITGVARSNIFFD